MNERLRVTLEFDDKGFVKGVRSSTSKLETFGRQVQRTEARLDRATDRTAGWGRALKDTAVTLASLNYLIPNLTNVLFGWQRGIISANAELEKSVAIMKNFSTETSDLNAELEARNFVDTITQKAAEAPFSINALTDSFVKMKVAGIDPLNGSFDALVDGVAAFGGKDDVLKRASIAIQQMGGKGVVSMEELRQQLGEAIPNAINLMATGLGTTYRELVDEISKGNVSSDIALIAMFEEMERQLGGSAERMMDTWNGLIAQMNTQFTILAREVGDSGYWDALKKQLNDLVSFLKTNDAKQFARDVGKALQSTVTTLRELIDFVIKYGEEIKSLAIGFGTFYVATKAVSVFKNALMPTIAAIGSFGKKMDMLNTAYNRVGHSQTKLTNMQNYYLNSIKKANVELGTRKSVTTAVTNAEVKLAQAQVATTVATQKKAIAVRAVNVALSTMKALTLTVLPLAIPMLIASAAHWATNRNEIQKNIDKLIKYQGAMATASQVEAAYARLKQLREEGDTVAKMNAALEERNKLQEQYDNLGNGQGFGDGVGGLAILQQIEALDKEILRIESIPGEIEKLEAVIKVGLEEAAKSIAQETSQIMDAQVNSLIASAQREYKVAVLDIRKNLDEELKALDKAGATDEEKGRAQEQANRLISEEAEKLAKQRLAAMQQVLEDFIAQRDALLTKEDPNSVMTANGYDKAILELERKIVDFQENKTDYTLTDALITGDGSGDAEAELKRLERVENSIEKTINKLKGELASFNLDDTSTTGGRFEEFLANLGDDAQLDVVKRNLGEIESLMQQVFQQENIEDTNKAFDKFVAKTIEAGEKTRAAFDQDSQGGISLVTKNVVAYELAMKDLIDDINEYVKVKDEQAAAEMIAVLGQQRSVAQMQDYAEMQKIVTQRSEVLARQLGRQKDNEAAYYSQLADQSQMVLESLDKQAAGYEGLSTRMQEYIAMLREVAALKGEEELGTLQQHIQDWGDVEKAINEVKVNALDGFVDTLAEGLASGKMSFSDFAESVIRDITKMIAKMIIFNAISAMMGGSGGAEADTPTVPFAKGGIMSSEGSVPLKKYARGGIANSPQLALFGEGSMPEAYVPLPDGRSIPVTIKGSAAGGNVEVNVINKSSNQVEGSAATRFDGEKMIVDVVLKNLSRPSPMREAVKNI